MYVLRFLPSLTFHILYSKVPLSCDIYAVCSKVPFSSDFLCPKVFSISDFPGSKVLPSSDILCSMSYVQSKALSCSNFLSSKVPFISGILWLSDLKSNTTLPEGLDII